MSYIALKVRWRKIIVLSEPAPRKGKCDESKDRIYEELEHIFYHFPKYHKKTWWGILMQHCGNRMFSNRQLGMRVYFRIVIVIVLE
jgi:hypothetical protein